MKPARVIVSPRSVSPSGGNQRGAASVVASARLAAPGGTLAPVRTSPAGPAFPVTRRSRPTRLARRSEPFLLLAGASALIALLATLYLTEANKAALMTYQINETQRQQAALLQTQGDLNLQLHEVESLQRIQTQAQALGMTPVNPNAVVYVNLPPVIVTVAPSAPLAQAGQ